jgi:hypothetical protein
MSAVLLVAALAGCALGDGARPATEEATATTVATPESAAARPAPAPRGAPGDNGTIMVFDAVGCSGGEAQGTSPTVTVPFSIGGTGFDANQAGTATIAIQPGGQVVFTASATADANGAWCLSPIDLPPGQYKVVFTFGNGTGKQKVFRVESVGSTTSSSSSSTTSLPATTTTVVAGSTTTTAGSTTTTSPTGPTTTEGGGGLPPTTTSSPAPSTTTTTALPQTTTTEVDAGGGAPTTTVAGGGGAGATTVPGTTLPDTTPGTGSGAWVTALIAALALLAGFGLVCVTRRPAAR